MGGGKRFPTHTHSLFLSEGQKAQVIERAPAGLGGLGWVGVCSVLTLKQLFFSDFSSSNFSHNGD